MTTILCEDGHSLAAYEVGEGERALIVAHEIFGVNSHIRSVTDRAAGAGFVAIAPSFFDRVQRGVELDYDDKGTELGLGLSKKLEWEGVVTDIEATLVRLKRRGIRSVGMTGFCWGGTATWLAANRCAIGAAVGYYGGGIARLIDRAPAVPTMLHFGELDTHIPMRDVEAISAAHPEVLVHTYPAGHGFHCDPRSSYDALSAKSAWDRTLDFFNTHLS